MATNLDMMKMVFDPKMEAILQAVKKTPKTVKDVAAELDDKPSRLYYPVQKLLSTGLLVVQEEKQVGNLIEKYYSSHHLFGANDVMQFEGELAGKNIDFLLPLILMSVNKGVNLLKEDLENHQNQDHSRAMYTETSAFLTPDEWVRANEAIRQIISERSGNEEDSKEYTFSLLTYEKNPTGAE
ncbi:ArsR family transcriptional regulator [Planococcus sp. FY231025]|uniref:ArsR family transcriptional regulator n=1 Tax=Planococcus sp. FY231025 TaxID=3455699 RepID=UPI003F911B9A